MTTLEILTRARALLVEKGWTQGAFARPTYDDAESYCAVVAVNSIVHQWVNA